MENELYWLKEYITDTIVSDIIESKIKPKWLTIVKNSLAKSK